MRFSDIKIGHIYNVIFDPVRFCEFDGKHLALVLKRNNDKQTFIVMPLTSEPKGNGANKIKLGVVNSLPNSLRRNDTYAVFNQIRTLNADRFIALKEGANIIESKIDSEVYTKLLRLAIIELIFNLEQDEKIGVLKKAYEVECIIKAKDLAYSVLKLQKETEIKKEEINRIKQEIKSIINNIPYTLEQKYIDDGIEDIFDDIFKEQ